MKVDIGEVLSKAWKIIWKFKVLWIFGILAGCSAANGNRFNYNFNNRTFNNSNQLPDFFQRFNGLRPERIMEQIWGHYSGVIIGVFSLLCCLWLIFYILGVIGRVGLIKGAGMADGGAERLSFGELWTGSLPYFWRMFGLNLLIGVPFAIIFILVVGGVLAAGFWTYTNNPQGGGAVAAIIGLIGLFFGLVCIISILGMIIGMIVEQAQNAIVLENLGVFAGLSRGWKVFKSAFLTILVMAIILGVLGWLAGLLFAIPAFVIAAPVAASLIAGAERARTLMFLIAGGCFVLYLPVLLVLNGILISYTQSVWTLVYRRLTIVPASAAPDTGQPVEPAPGA